MLRPFDPNSGGLMKLDRIVSDSGTGVLYAVTFAVIYVLFLAVQAVTALPRLLVRRSAAFVHALRHPA